MADIFDRLPSGSLDDFHKFREGCYNFLYLCKTCNRSFDSVDKANSCKFCGSGVVELRSTIKGKTTRYMYHCPVCDKNFTTTEKLTVCNICRTDYLHVYTWDMLRRREKLYIKIRKAFANIFAARQNQPQLRQMRLPHIAFSSDKGEELPTY